MPHSYHNLLYHILYSTHERRPWIDAEVEARLHAYTGGVIRKLGGIALEIGGVNDHLHILARLRPDKAVSDILRVIKAESSGWVHTTFPNMAGFAWQEGYTAFTVSESQVNRLRRYICNQGLHHRRMSFQKEVVKLLNAHGVHFDERYLCAICGSRWLAARGKSLVIASASHLARDQGAKPQEKRPLFQGFATLRP